MQKRALGSTGIQVSCIGLGTVKFGRNQGVKYPAAFELPSDKTLSDLLAQAKEAGINLLDTAPAYGLSEERLGKLLQGQRQDWVLSTKAGELFVDGVSQFDFSAKAIRESVESSLKKLKTDYLDLVLGHSNGDDLRLIQDEQIFESFEQLKQAGKIRAYGLSTKTVEGGLLTVEHADVAMVTYNHDEQQDKAVIDRAHQLKKGIVIKKALSSGHLKASVQAALSFALSPAGVSSVIVGTINPAHLQEIVKVG